MPIVEGLKRGLPVFASDIAVFREIGREDVTFVDLNAPVTLADALAEHVAHGAHRVAAPIAWLTWRANVLQLRARIEECLATRAPARPVMLASA